MTFSLSTKYEAENGQVLMTGSQALVRLPMAQVRRDRAAGLDTGVFISGYRGSPLGGLDKQFIGAREHYEKYDVLFQPGVNEDLALTAVWGSQQLHLSPGAQKQGVVGIWYGKGPGVDRSGDVFKHGNAAGSSAYGGVLAIAGDDHSCKSSSIPHQSDHAFMSALMPVLYPSSVNEFIELGLLGIAMSRYSGCWIGFKVISETVESTTVVDLSQERKVFNLPQDFVLPSDGLNLRWPDPPREQDARLQDLKGYAALAFARANRVDHVTYSAPKARFGIVASGKAYEDVCQALHELGLDEIAWQAIGLRLYKVRMPWPLEPDGVRAFSTGLEEILIVEERREIIENQIKQALFNWCADKRPRIIGKFDDRDRPVLSLSKTITVERVAAIIAQRIMKFDLPESLSRRIAERLAQIQSRIDEASRPSTLPKRQPHFCAGCPHNISTRLPSGSKAMAGIGCHFMAQWMDRDTETFTHMGGEGVPWTAISSFSTEAHRFVNMGDGTYFHSGQLAIRQSVTAGANVTYKILFNNAVAMTGGQAVDGDLTPQKISHQVAQEGASYIVLVSDEPEKYHRSALAAGTEIRHRDDIETVMLALRQMQGTTVLIYDQSCAAENRRHRKRGTKPEPLKRLWINPDICEGCGDCTVQSNCIAIEPLETPMGRKRQINQSICNSDFSCEKGFCPAFVTLQGASTTKSVKPVIPDDFNLPKPKLPAMDTVWNLCIAGIGGSGVVTLGALLAMAAYIDGKALMALDMAGLAQKGGGVISTLRLGPVGNQITSPNIPLGRLDLLLAADPLVAASESVLPLCAPDRSYAVLNTHIGSVSEFVRQRDFNFQKDEALDKIKQVARRGLAKQDFMQLASVLGGGETMANMMLLGYAWQAGLVPLTEDAILRAIRLNNVTIDDNNQAFWWGRALAHDAPWVERALKGEALAPKVLDDMSLPEIIEHRSVHLQAYQGEALVARYRAKLEALSCHLARSGEQTRQLERLAAVSYARLLSYKDEYEIARLYSKPEFMSDIKSKFTGTYKIALNMAPPIFAGRLANGRPKKRPFGRWIFPVLAILRFFKVLRGSVFDPFGWTAERRAERRLIGYYEQDLDLAASNVCANNLDLYRELLAWPLEIRGFGPVKMEAIDKQLMHRAAIRQRLLAKE
jgi:indolepyruvate ferredoxin oxidoreductase